MPAWALQIIIAAMPLFGKLIDKLLPEKHVPTMRRMARIPCDWTQAKIASYGRKKGIV